MRGKRFVQLSSTQDARITPADAGKTSCGRVLPVWARDHPRGCGENMMLNLVQNPYQGSPPRMRGKRFLPLFATAHPGITPADAGKTIWRAVVKPQEEDHPRGCGENELYSVLCNGCRGSPPRMRGKQCICYDGIDYTRITPADAGKTQK